MLNFKRKLFFTVRIIFSGFEWGTKQIHWRAVILILIIVPLVDTFLIAWTVSFKNIRAWLTLFKNRVRLLYWSYRVIVRAFGRLILWRSFMSTTFKLRCLLLAPWAIYRISSLDFELTVWIIGTKWLADRLPLPAVLSCNSSVIPQRLFGSWKVLSKNVDSDTCAIEILIDFFDYFRSLL